MAVAGAAYLLNGSGDIDTAYSLLCGAIAMQPEPYDPADATLFEALHTLLLVCFFGGRPALWSQFDAATAKYPAGPQPPILPPRDGFLSWSGTNSMHRSPATCPPDRPRSWPTPRSPGA